MNTEIEAVDNDGDSEDWDGDGYVNGQEFKYGTDCLTMLRIRVCSIHRLNLNLLQCTSMKTITTGIIPMHRRLQRVTMMMVIVRFSITAKCARRQF